jgi:hypothetical protein
MSKTTKKDKGLEFPQTPEQQKENAESQRKFCEELAAKLIGDQKSEPDWENPMVLNWNERIMAASALRYVAEHVITGKPKPRRGNPNNERQFDHEWAAIRFALLVKDDMKPTSAYTALSRLIGPVSGSTDDISTEAVRQAIKPYLARADKFVNKGKIKVQDKIKK